MTIVEYKTIVIKIRIMSFGIFEKSKLLKDYWRNTYISTRNTKNPNAEKVEKREINWKFIFQELSS